MNKRELILAIFTALLILGGCAYFAVDSFFLSPAREYLSKHQSLYPRYKKDEARYKRQIKSRTALRQVASMQMAQDEESVRIAMREHLNASFKNAGMTGSLSLKPITGRKMKGVYLECGWSVQAEANIENVTNFLYLLEEEEQLQRVANLSITPQLKTNTVTVTFKYMTLVIDPKLHAKSKKSNSNAATTQPAATQPKGRMINDQQHEDYQLIASRDVFRPYLKLIPKPVKPAPKKTPTKRPPTKTVTRPTPKPPAPDRFLVVGLPSWGDQQEIYLKDPKNGATRTVKPGDPLLGGEITGIDYRSMPHPADPEISSGSRVILRLEQSYFAVELGDALNKRYPMTIEELPEELREMAIKHREQVEKAPATQPADMAKDTETGSP